MSTIFDKYGGGRKTIVQRQLSSLVPYSSFWRSINRAYEKAATGKTMVRQDKSFWAPFHQVIPGLSQKTPAKLDIWGNEIELEGNVFRQWLPYKWSKETDEPLEKEFERLGIYPGLPGAKVVIDGKDVEFKGDFYRNYLIDFGKFAKTELDDVIKSKFYKSLSDENKSKLLDKKLTQIRQRKLMEAKKRYKQSGGLQ